MSTVLLVAAISSAAANSVAVPPPPALKAFSYVLIDAHSGALLAEYAADAATAPGDLTKLMTAYVVFEALEQGRLALDESVSVSEDALRAPGQRMFIESDHRVTVHDLLKGLVVQAANDAAIALAEHVAGSESAFVQEMNERAELLGMTATAYRNSTGAAAEDQVTTARDAATLAQAIIANFPNHYPLYSQRELTYNEITQHNPNALLWRDPSVDGLTATRGEATGHGLVASAERSGMRLISVVMGMESEEARTLGSGTLLNYGFRHFETHRLYAAGDTLLTERVWRGSPQSASLGLKADLFVTIPRGQYSALSAVMEVPAQLLAPLDSEAPLGTVKVSLAGREIATGQLVALQPIKEAGLLRRMLDQVLLWFE